MEANAPTSSGATDVVHLPPIPEEDSSMESTREELDNIGLYLKHVDIDMQASLNAVNENLKCRIESEMQAVIRDELSDRMPLSLS